MAKKKVTKVIEPVKTTRMYFTDTCPHCKGSGRLPSKSGSEGWYIEYRYQSDRELSKPMSKKDAIKDMNEDDFGCARHNKTVIGPNGYVYTID